MTTLFINACVRGKESRTLKLCHEYLEGLENVEEVDLGSLRLEPFYKDDIAKRARFESAGDFSDKMFDLAKQFAAADDVVIGAPYWDLSFPAVLKIYAEHTSVCNITFHYTEQGACEGLCSAESLTYITTCGGSAEGANLGYEYFCGLAKLFGIPKTRLVAAENLDIAGIDVSAQMEKAFKAISDLKASR